MAVTVSKLSIQLQGSTGTLGRDLKQAQGPLDQFSNMIGGRMGGLLGSASGMLGRFSSGLTGLHPAALAGAAGLGILTGALGGLYTSLRALFTFVSAQAGPLDDLAKRSRLLGVSAMEMQAFALAAEQVAGMEFRQASIGLQRFTRRLQDAAVNGGPLQDMLKRVGVDLQELSGNPLEAFRALADQIKSLSDQGFNQLLASFQAFDSEGAKLLLLLRQGSGELDKFQDKVAELGGEMDQQQLDAMENYNDALSDVQFAWRSFTQQVGAEIAPALTDLLKWALQFRPMLDDVIDGVVGFVAVIRSAEFGKFLQFWKNLGMVLLQTLKYLTPINFLIASLIEQAFDGSKVFAELGREMRKTRDAVVQPENALQFQADQGFDLSKAPSKVKLTDIEAKDLKVRQVKSDQMAGAVTGQSAWQQWMRNQENTEKAWRARMVDLLEQLNQKLARQGKPPVQVVGL